MIGNRTPLGYLQFRHQLGRFITAVAGVAVAVVLMFMQLGFLHMLFENQVRTHKSFNAEIMIVSSRFRDMANPGTFPRVRLLQALGVTGVKDGEAVFLGRMVWPNSDTGERVGMQVIGVRPDFHAFRDPKMQAALALVKGRDTVAFDRQSRGGYARTLAKLDAGHQIPVEIHGNRLYLVGTFELGASFGTDGTLLVSDDTFLRLDPTRRQGSVTIGLIQTLPGFDPAVVAEAIRSLLPHGDISIMTQSEFAELEQDFMKRETPIAFVFTFGAAMGLLVGFTIVFQILSADVTDHLPEYATMKAMGFGDTYLFKIVFEQSIILAVLGYIPGLILSFGLYEAVRSLTMLPIAMTPDRLAVVFFLTFGMSVFSGALVMRKLRKADPADVFTT